jgi:hypothetical protein
VAHSHNAPAPSNCLPAAIDTNANGTVERNEFADFVSLVAKRTRKGLRGGQLLGCLLAPPACSRADHITLPLPLAACLQIFHLAVAELKTAAAASSTQSETDE